MYITHPDLVLDPQETRVVTYTGESIIQNKNIVSGLVVNDIDVIGKDQYLLAPSGQITIKNLGWTHAFVSISESTGTPIPPTSITVTGTGLVDDVLTVYAGASTTLSAAVLPAEAYQGVDWVMTDSTVATVSSAGRVVGVKVGSTVLTVSSKTTPTVKKVITVNITQNPINVQSKGTITGKRGGDVVQLTDMFTFNGSTASQYDYTVTPTGAGTVNAVAGTFTIALDTIGDLTVKAQHATVTTATATTPVTGILAPLPASVSVTPAGPVTLEIDGTQQLTSTVSPAQAPQAVNYVSSAPLIATVSATGLITAISAGNANITVTPTTGSGSQVVAVVVNTPPVVDIPATAVYLDSVPFAILNSVNNPPPAFTTNPPNASGYTVAYEAEGASITVNPDGTYNVVGSASGSRIKVVLTNSDTTQVNDSSGIVVSELSAYTASTTATNVGATYQLDYTIEPTEVATHPDLVLTFTTTDPLVATISNTGLATGTGDGFCRIGVEANFRGATASDSSGFTVNAVP